MSEAEFDEIVTSIYRTIEDQNHWADVLGTVARKVGGDKGVLYSSGMFPEDGGLWVIKNIADSSIDRYVRHFSALDTYRLTAEVHGLLDGGIRTGDQVIPRTELCRTEYYNDFCRPFGLEHLIHFVQPVAMNGFAPIIHFSVFGEGSPFDEESIRKLAQYKPHLQQALVLRSLVEGQMQVNSARMLVQALPDPALLVDRGLCIVAANDGGAALLRAGVFLRSEKGLLVTPPVGRELLPALDLLFKAGARAEPRTFGVRTAEQGACLYNVAPISLDWLAGRRRDHALITIRQQRQREADVQLLRGLYGLTETELKVARELVRGEQVRDISEKWRVSQETVRSHVKNVLSKTGCRRQGDLIRLVWSSFPVR